MPHSLLHFFILFKFFLCLSAWWKKKQALLWILFKKIYSELKFKSINFIWLRLIYFSSRIKVKFCCCILSSAVTNSLRILLLIPPSLFTRWRVIGKSQQYQLDNVKATTNAYRIRHYLLKTFFKNRTIAEKCLTVVNIAGV